MNAKLLLACLALIVLFCHLHISMEGFNDKFTYDVPKEVRKRLGDRRYGN